MRGLRDPDVVVIGGGLAGAAAALRLARAGVSVTVIERQAGPHHKVCGEFLSAEALADLEDLGLDVAALGAVPLGAVGYATGRRTVVAPLPFPAASLSRRRLDAALLQAARAAGARVIAGHGVRSLVWSDGSVAVRLDDGRTLSARAAFVATGKHELPGHARPIDPAAGPGGDLVGFKQHFAVGFDRPGGPAPRGRRTAGGPYPAEAVADAGALLPARVDVVPFRGGYAGLQPVGVDRLNLCLVVDRTRLAAAGGRFETLLPSLLREAPALGARLADAVPLLERPLACARIPYGFVRTRTDGPVWWLGDQAAVIPSFSGDGMAIALFSARRAAEAYLAGRPAAAFQADLAAETAVPVRRAGRVAALLGRPALAAAAGLVLRAAPFLMGRIALATRVSDARPRHPIPPAPVVSSSRRPR